MVPEDYFTLQQLADYLKRSKRTVQRMIKMGEGPPVIRLGRRRLFAKASVADWLRRKEHLPLSGKQDSPNLDIVAALRELETHGENGVAYRLFVWGRGEPLSLEELERYLHRLLADGIKRLPLAAV